MESESWSLVESEKRKSIDINTVLITKQVVFQDFSRLVFLLIKKAATTPSNLISVLITVIDDVTNTPTINQTWEATANVGDSIFVIMKKLQQQQSSFRYDSVASFSFLLLGLFIIAMFSFIWNWNLKRFPFYNVFMFWFVIM